MSRHSSSSSASLVDLAAQNPGLSIPLVAGSVALLFAASQGRYVVSKLLAHHGLPPEGNVLPLLFFLFNSAVTVVCFLSLRRTVARQGGGQVLGLLLSLYRQLSGADRLVVAGAALALVMAFVAVFVL